MKKGLLFVQLIFLAAGSSALSQESKGCGESVDEEYKKEKIGIVIYSNDPETVWNAFRLACFSQEEGDTVSVFLLGKGVEATDIVNKDFDVKEKIESFVGMGGKILACGTCLNIRKTTGKSNVCSVSSLADLYIIIKKSDKLLTF